jgi:hypothetical protein
MGDNRLFPAAGGQLNGAMSMAGTARAADTATTAEAALPLLGLRITAGPIELRGITDDLLGPLAGLVVEGITSPGGPPLLTPWKTEPPQDLPRFFAQYYWQLRADFCPDRWTAPLAAPRMDSSGSRSESSPESLSGEGCSSTGSPGRPKNCRAPVTTVAYPPQ